jgi:hypothetical protein
LKFDRSEVNCPYRDLHGRKIFWIFWVACRSWSNGLRRILRSVGSMLYKPDVWLLWNVSLWWG